MASIGASTTALRDNLTSAFIAAQRSQFAWRRPPAVSASETAERTLLPNRGDAPSPLVGEGRFS